VQGVSIKLIHRFMLGSSTGHAGFFPFDVEAADVAAESQDASWCMAESVDVTTVIHRPEPVPPTQPSSSPPEHQQQQVHDPLPLARVESAAERLETIAATRALIIGDDAANQREAILLAEKLLMRRYGWRGRLTNMDWIHAVAAVSAGFSVDAGSVVLFGAVQDLLTNIVNERFQLERMHEELYVQALEDEAAAREVRDVEMAEAEAERAAELAEAEEEDDMEFMMESGGDLRAALQAVTQPEEPAEYEPGALLGPVLSTTFANAHGMPWSSSAPDPAAAGFAAAAAAAAEAVTTAAAAAAAEAVTAAASTSTASASAATSGAGAAAAAIIEPPEPDVVDEDQMCTYERAFGSALAADRLKRMVLTHVGKDGASPAELVEAYASEALRLKELSRRGPLNVAPFHAERKRFRVMQ